ncbi:MAG TPA: TonB-dependent receptor [Aquabacterium sp.]|uniref:TonB-dependent receptor plug domain-containing protein n=1 Tax=Aquabacterium sp. TaxID=1872578 RepID=UPI002E35FDAA|nr:TonB-dependent receptor [Aquabacterium sp.]HEX5371227.1 TonB-dependent receptor [Aquabacterium sp.]
MNRQRHLVDSQPRLSTLTASVLCALALVAPACAQQSDEDELALAYGEQPFVSIATGSRQPLTRAPAVATVITDDDIAAMGATDLDEVLETVPGLHVARSTQTFTPNYVIRGIYLGYTPQVLMLLNGIPLTSIYTGNRGNVWGGMTLDNIARIEVIRGPGSALYGADAFSGVINIITKSAADVDGTQVGLRAGSFKTGDAWMLHGGTWGAVDVSAYLRVGSTQGSNSVVQADAQTGWDGVFNTQVSHAPGRISNSRDSIDASLTLAWKRWQWRTHLKERSRVGSGTGVASALDPTGENYSQNFSSDLSYEHPQIAPGWDLSLQASGMHYKEFSDLTLFPAGFAGFTDGMIGNPYKWERHYHLGGSALYTGLQAHRIRLGVGVEHQEVYKTQESKNFNPDYSRIGTGSVSDVIDVSDTAPFMRPHGRIKRYVYVQDEWSMAKDWTLTAGLRHDDHSDFGSTTNPRLALVWEAAYNVTAKVLYGSAFRAPSMSELYAINNPVVTGNAALKPEKIDTLEAAVAWHLRPGVQLGLNLFHYRMKDIIRLSSNVYQNTGGQHGNGLELEGNWDVGRTLHLSGNYSYQYSQDQTTDQDAGNAPHHHLYLRADWRFMPSWSLHPQVNWISERPRVAGDTRRPLAGYGTVDMTLRHETAGNRGWSVALSVRNLLDVDAREPSPYDRSLAQPFISLPDDIPLPGRTVSVQASYRF